MDQRNRLVGNQSQLCMVRRVTFRDDVSEGVRAVELLNESGLYITCIEDQCLNIYDFSYKGVNCAFHSKNGLVSNRFFNGGANEFNYYWPAGMLYTCGLTNTGVGVKEATLYHAEHGRIGMLPAKNVNVVQTNEAVLISGDVFDQILCGHQLRLHRTITIPKQGKEISIRDEITNMEGISTEMMLLYHCNFGYPLLTPVSRVVCSMSIETNAINDKQAAGSYEKMQVPRDDKEEVVICHSDIQGINDYGFAAIVNDELELGCYLKYKLDTLPFLIQWNNMCAHDYVVGLEPANSHSRGRREEREAGTICVMHPYETKTYEVTIGILDGADEICQFEKKCRQLY